MYRKLIFTLCLVLFSVAMVVAEDNGPNGLNGQDGPNGVNEVNGANDANASGYSGAKMVGGMAVLGNNEAPMSLFIVPWKSSELGVETNLNRTLNEHDVPVDRDVFLRELDFYQVSVGSKTAAPAAVSQISK